MATIQFAESSPFKDKINSIVDDILIDYTVTLCGSETIKTLLFPLYVKLFHEVPNYINLGYYNEFCNGELEAFLASERFSEESCQEEHNAFMTFKNDILEQQTFQKIIENYPGDDIAVFRYDEYPAIFIESLKCIVYYTENNVAVLCNKTTIPDFIKDNVVTESDVDAQNNRYFDYVIYGQHGFDTTCLPVKKHEVDIERNYNDDLPHDAIMDFIKNGRSGICILNGAPGTGKTHYIRHLMWECPDTEFMILNASCFDAINDSSFVEMILNNKNAVVILEDCEDLLTDRLGNNSRIGTLLNISEGILGDALKLRFICTFNAPVNKIDNAVIRKGRTHVKYEFKALTYNKAAALAEHLGVELPEKKNAKTLGYTLAEIYNSDNKYVPENENSLGFKR